MRGPPKARHDSERTVLDTQPADWDVTKATRIWDSLLTKYPDISAAFFHNDDMALAAQNVMKARGRDKILVGGVDAMPPAIEAVIDGRMLATVRNPSCRIHGGAIVAGVAAVVAGLSALGFLSNVWTLAPRREKVAPGARKKTSSQRVVAVALTLLMTMAALAAGVMAIIGL